MCRFETGSDTEERHNGRIKCMKDIPFTNMTVFILFFGIALIEAIQGGNWIQAALFLALGVLSLRADFFKNK